MLFKPQKEDVIVLEERDAFDHQLSSSNTVKLNLSYIWDLGYSPIQCVEYIQCGTHVL